MIRTFGTLTNGADASLRPGGEKIGSVLLPTDRSGSEKRLVFQSRFWLLWYLGSCSHVNYAFILIVLISKLLNGIVSVRPFIVSGVSSFSCMSHSYASLISKPKVRVMSPFAFFES